MKQRVLILSTSVGSGHISAARALEQVFRQSPQVGEIVNKDALEFTNDAFRDFYAALFLRLVKNNPRFLGWWYDESDEPWKTDDIRLALDRLNTQPLAAFIREFRPTITVCTHFMPAGVVSHLLTRGHVQTSLAIVTTDYDFHSMWLSRRFHRYFVALESTRAHLRMLGMPEERITVSGIPVDPVFCQPIDRAAVLAKYRLSPDLPILLLSAGTVGGGPIAQIVDRLMALQHEVQTVIICGRNEGLRRDIETQVLPMARRFRVLGFTDQMSSLMKVATLFIGKPGGLTSAECMAVGLPMVVGMPIPGQEERNADHLLEHGAAIKFNDITVLTYKIDTLLDDPERLARMRDSACRLGRPGAAQMVVDTLLNEELADPHHLDRQARQQMVGVIKGAVTTRPEPTRPGVVGLYHEHTGVAIGVLTEAQFRFLATHLVNEGAHDNDYYINQATIEMLRGLGADPNLLALLQDALADSDEADIRWTCF